MNHKANKISTKVLVAALLLAALFCLCACVAVTGVTVDKTELNLVEGESVVVTATVAPEDADDKTVTWTTSDSAVATVDNGKITAIAEGTAIVTVTTTDGEFKATVSVTVTAKDVLTHVAAKAATCTASGNVEYWKSEKTGKYYSDAEGKTEITSITVEPIGHTAGVAATCDQPQICTVCEQVMKAALGHKYGAWTVITEPTETTEGSAEKVCVNDNSHKETVLLPCLDESNGYVYTITAQPIGDVDGIGTYTYAYDNYLFTFDVAITATGHAWDNGKITVQPTCEEKGIKVYTCTKCGSTMEKTLVAYDHTYRLKSVVSEPTCTETGVQIHRCMECGEEKRVTTRALGHDGEVYWEVAVAPTETTTGKLVKTCGRDGCVVETAELDVLDREYSGFYLYDRLNTDDDDAYDQVMFTYYGKDKKDNAILDVNGDHFKFALDVDDFYVVTFLYRNQWVWDVPIEYVCEVNAGDKVEVPSEIITEGEVFDTNDGYYFFSHYRKYGGSSDVFDPEKDVITYNTRIEAIYTRKVQVTVEDHDGGVIAREFYEIGKAIEMPDAPECSGYRFNGWKVKSSDVFKEGEEPNVTYTVKDTASKDMTITADCVKQYNVTFKYLDANGAKQVVGPTLYDVNTPASELEIPELPETIKGYKYVDPENPWKVAPGAVTEDVVYEVNCVKTFDVTFVYYSVEGIRTEVGPEAYAEGTKVADILIPSYPEQYTKDGETYRFTGWSEDLAPVTKTVTYEAQYVRQFKVTFEYMNADGTEADPFEKWYDKGTKGGKIQTPTLSNILDDPELFGYVDVNDNDRIFLFDNWFDEETGEKLHEVTGHATYVAKYEEVFTLLFVNEADADYNYTLYVTQGYGADEWVDAFETPVKAADTLYYEFVGWSTNEDATKADAVFKNIQANATYYAIFQPRVKVTFVDHDGVALEGVKPQLVAIYSGATPPSTYVCSNPRHTFTGTWETVEANENYAAVTGNVKDVTVKPVCEASWVVKFVGEDGETSVLSGNRESLPVVEGNKVAETDIPAVTKEADRELGAYKFVGWTIQGTETVLTSEEVADKAIDADVTFVATFELMPTVVIENVIFNNDSSDRTVDVTVKIMNNPGIFGATLMINFDEGLKIIDLDETDYEYPLVFGAKFPENQAFFAPVFDGTNTQNITWTTSGRGNNVNAKDEAAVFVTITFTVDASVSVGDVLSIEFTTGTMFANSDAHEVTFGQINGSVTVQ